MKIHVIDENNSQFYCPGCIDIHNLTKNFRITGMEENKPTIRGGTIRNIKEIEGFKEICHIRMEFGKLTFLQDTTHQLKGDTIDMIEIDEIL